MYIDQQGGKSVKFTFIPNVAVDCVVLLTDESNYPVVLGYLLAQTPEYTFGDLNGDGKVNNIDLNKAYNALRKHIIFPSEKENLAADVNEDKAFNNIDLNMLYNFIHGRIAVLGKQKSEVIS